MSEDIFKDTTIKRLGSLTPQERSTVTRLHKEKKPPGYIFGWIHGGRLLRRSNDPKSKTVRTDPKPVRRTKRTDAAPATKNS